MTIGFLPSKGKRVGANEWSAWCVRRLATRLRTNLVYWRKPGRCRLGAGQKGECQYGHRSAVTAS